MHNYYHVRVTANQIRFLDLRFGSRNVKQSKWPDCDYA